MNIGLFSNTTSISTLMIRTAQTRPVFYLSLFGDLLTPVQLTLPVGVTAATAGLISNFKTTANKISVKK